MDLAPGAVRRSTLDRTGFALLALAVAAAVVIFPFALASMIGSLRHPDAARAFRLTVFTPGQRSTTAVNVHLVGIDEVAQNVTLDVTGDRSCAAACGSGQVLRFFSLHADPRGSDGAPPAQTVAVPRDGEFDATVVLPVTGGLGAYPFDRYQLFLGVALAQRGGGGRLSSVPAASARRQLAVSVDEQLSRLDLATPRDVTSRYHYVGAQIAVAGRLDLSRPLYLQALTVLLVLFMGIAGVYSVVARAFKEVIGTVGVVVLGVWGVRTLLVGSYPPDSTAVDLLLIFLTLVLLLIVMGRGLLVMWRRMTPDEGVVVPSRERFRTAPEAEGLESFSEFG